eukprot:TRINITY_DN113060_c0_g1_i1.p1 TRINITY_DN113060_c0_g1~~TRINITY_DN113060_c0_g1_i1.p1  ORF type:complete len:401 (+),score=100.78 TRINITY_DN113060_c0_g1_i1:72-1274(+)
MGQLSAGCCYAWTWPAFRNASASTCTASSSCRCETQPTVADVAEAHFSWEDVLADASKQKRLCQAMQSKGFVVLAVPSSLCAAVAQMQDLAEEFFTRPREERCALGRLRLYRDKVIGYRELGGGCARFLEVHTMAGGGAIPLPKAPRGLGPVAVKLHRELQAMARLLLTWLAEHAKVPGAALLQCIDAASLENLEEGDCSASVLRLCSYGFETDSTLEDGVAAQAANICPETGESVVFDEHTDASFLTLAPVGTVPGLQFRDPVSSDLAWQNVESGFGGRGEYLVAFVGDFLEVLTKGCYTAARHRVCCGQEKEASATRRLSMPFLVRGQPSSCLDTRPFLDAVSGEAGNAEEDDVPLLRLEGVRYSQLRQFLDLKGRRRFQGARLLSASAAEAEGKQEA